MRKRGMEELGRLSEAAFREAEKHPCHLILDNVRSVLNVGSIFRTADAFRCEKIWLGGLTPEPSPEMNKTALGALEVVNWEKREELTSLLEELREAGFEIWAVEQTTASVSLAEWRIPARGPLALLWGNEVTGIDETHLALCQGCIEIPQYGTKHSLNVAVSAGVVLWEYIRQYHS
jgi:tRNA G18 (ribose-2'-O)-methylase SpoU